jgi:hypothetical protein
MRWGFPYLPRLTPFEGASILFLWSSLWISWSRVPRIFTRDWHELGVLFRVRPRSPLRDKEQK